MHWKCHLVRFCSQKNTCNRNNYSYKNLPFFYKFSHNNTISPLFPYYKNISRYFLQTICFFFLQKTFLFHSSIAANIPAFPDVPALIPALFCTGSRNIPQILCGSCQFPAEASIIFLFSPPPSPLYSMSIFYHTFFKWQPPVSGSKKPAGIFQCPPVLFFYGNRMLAERAFYFYAIFTAMQCAAAINLSAELHIVVAGSGLPHFKHVDRVCSLPASLHERSRTDRLFSRSGIRTTHESQRLR